jgi:FMN phosphatase YigB (HAD superfamily)
MIRSSDDNVELIKKLGELKKVGIITNKEFQAKKKQLLDKI